MFFLTYHFLFPVPGSGGKGGNKINGLLEAKRDRDGGGKFETASLYKAKVKYNFTLLKIIPRKQTIRIQTPSMKGQPSRLFCE